MRNSTAAKISRKHADKNGVSRFHRLNGNSFRVWSPPGSHYKIEYSTAVLREVRMQGAQADSAGVLYGRRENGTIRVVAARDSANAADARLTGLAPIGIFASRVRGEVFLTESDLERFEKPETEALVALVIAGTKAGFFVHEPDGSLQSIKSHLEFSLDEPPPAPEPIRAKPAPAPAPVLPRRRIGMRPIWAASAVLCAMFCAVLAGLWLVHARRPVPRPPLALTVQEQDGALRIDWNPRALEAAAPLEIRDGPETQSIAANPALSSVLYVRRSGDVEVRLAGQSAHFLGIDPPVPPVERMRQQVAELDAEARDLKTTAAIRNRRVAELEKILSKMDLAH